MIRANGQAWDSLGALETVVEVGMGVEMQNREGSPRRWRRTARTSGQVIE